MSASAQTQETTKEDEKKIELVYDAQSNMRLEFEVKDKGEVFDTAHIFSSLQDDRYCEWLNELALEGNENKVTENVTEASLILWDELIVEVEDIDIEVGEDFKPLIDDDEKLTGINAYLAVAIVEIEKKAEKGKKRNVRKEKSETEVIVTEAYVDGELSQQQHEIVNTDNHEWEKKYGRIYKKQYKKEITKGLRRKPKFKFVSQADAFGELYDEMFVSQSGFKEGFIPLRFKTKVLEYKFADKIQPKK